MPAYRHPYADLRQRIGMRWLPVVDRHPYADANA